MTYLPEYLHMLLHDDNAQMRTKMYHLGHFLTNLGVLQPLLECRPVISLSGLPVPLPATLE
jgi:hypothetical protein